MRKTTLASLFAKGMGDVVRFDLESPADLQRLSAPMQVLGGLKGLVVLDEIQRRPQLFEILRVLADRPACPCKFLILGSASPGIVKGVSESLAGRVGFVDLAGFSLGDVGRDAVEPLWVRGGFPRSFLADSDADSLSWRDAFIRTFLERDIPQLGITTPAETLRRFWTMTAHHHGQVWNAAEFARSLGSSEPTARRYLEILSGAFMLRILPPWHENLAKRQVKSPRIYLRDSGLLRALLGLESLHALRGYSRMEASWEGFAMEQTLACLGARECYFWSTHGGAEVDLLVPIRGRRYGFEFKFGDAPGATRSMHSALHDLRLERLFVVCPGTEPYALDDTIEVLPLRDLPARASSFGLA